MTHGGRTARLLTALFGPAWQSGAEGFAETLPGSRLSERQRFSVEHRPGASLAPEGL